MNLFRSFRFFILLGFCLGSVFAGRAADVPSNFDAANTLYNEGKFSDAATAYDKLLASGNCSEAIYFNRGNALLKQGQVGRAIASYLQAQQLAPHDPALRANLQVARVRARGGQPFQLDRWRSFFGKLSLNEWTVLAVIAFWLLFLLLAALQWRPTLKPALRSYCFAVGAVVVVLGICLA